jgi:hypothetical protein
VSRVLQRYKLTPGLRELRAEAPGRKGRSRPRSRPRTPAVTRPRAYPYRRASWLSAVAAARSRTAYLRLPRGGGRGVLVNWCATRRPVSSCRSPRLAVTWRSPRGHCLRRFVVIEREDGDGVRRPAVRASGGADAGSGRTVGWRCTPRTVASRQPSSRCSSARVAVATRKEAPRVEAAVISSGAPTVGKVENKASTPCVVRTRIVSAGGRNCNSNSMTEN